MSKEDFKLFVKSNPNLVSHVNNNEITWQRLYEMYSLYGDDRTVWSNYLNPVQPTSTKITPTNEVAFKELINMVKNIDLEKVRHGIEGVQRTISLVQDLGFGGNSKIREEYQGRPIYQHFDD